MAQHEKQNVTKFKLKHDRLVQFATGSSRKSVEWRNKELLWSEFLQKLSKTTRTRETYLEYKGMKKSEQDNIKDVGGFVGGYIKNSRRKAGNVMNRSMLTLDIDFGDEYVVDTIEMLFNKAYAIYSTHKHSNTSPRLRLVIPLSRNVTSEEYAPIGKKVADNIGIDYFDDTTYQPHRLMYWPSTSSDGDWYFDYQDGELLDPDEILEQYNGHWQDPNYWPISSRQEREYKSMADKQGDPLSKPGLVGAFNRAYNIHEAIQTFLSDKYTAFGDDRYTYIDGSTSGGLVVYENGNFAYSHHGTDIISSRLVNSFDLVRMHLFGAMDIDKDDDTPVNKLPSFKEMNRFAQKDKQVAATLTLERMSEALDDFDEITEEQTTEEKKESLKWTEGLTITRDGDFELTVPNLLLILQNDPRLKGKIALNEFSRRLMRLGKMPWLKVEKFENWTDADDAGLREYIESVYSLYHKGKLEDAIHLAAKSNAFHPVRDYLDGLEWDGIKRLETIFHTFLGSEDSEINRAITRKAFSAAVARIYEPGIKFDYMLTLYGSQGLGKSMILNKMGGDYFSDSITSMTGKEAFEALQGAWIIEMGELAATKKAEVETIKHFISKQVDRFRVAYGRNTEDFPRQCVFFGTTNREDFLRDDTGGRRFWPISVGKVKPQRKWTTLTKDERDQLWAEAKHYYQLHEPLYLTDELETTMRELQSHHTEESPWVGIIENYLEIELPVDWESKSVNERRQYLNSEFDDALNSEETYRREYVCAAEVWCECLGNDRNKFPINDQRTINAILRNLDGWKPYDKNSTGKKKFGKNYGIQRAFSREI
ncbi:VapE domain-containing protein [Macrococcus capreoli]|uniref:VapE domain-containing protein n=1 Tax=Macrococcus capreoli TaxID=2982690 RepID=UPI003EE77746